KVISDTAEYGCYLFSHAAVPLLKEFMAKQKTDVIGKPFGAGNQVDNRRLLTINQAIEAHPVEKVGAVLRGHMTAMKQIAVGGSAAAHTRGSAARSRSRAEARKPRAGTDIGHRPERLGQIQRRARARRERNRRGAALGRDAASLLRSRTLRRRQQLPRS